MPYCNVNDLYDTYGETKITNWASVDPDRVDKAIADASAEIDGYLLSGGYAVPLPGTPPTIRKYCVDIASAALVISSGVLGESTDPGGNAVLENAKNARAFLTKVAEGKFKIPGADGSAADGDAGADAPSSGNIQIKGRKRLDLRRY
jgi:phage gp36-like protein